MSFIIWFTRCHSFCDYTDSEYYYDNAFIDTSEILKCGDPSYRFELNLPLKSRGKVKVKSKRKMHLKFSVFELIHTLQTMNLSTTNAVWQKIPKNEDDLIGDQQNLCLCLHILICIAVQNKYKGQYTEDEYNRFQVFLCALMLRHALKLVKCYWTDSAVRWSRPHFCSERSGVFEVSGRCDVCTLWVFCESSGTDQVDAKLFAVEGQCE